MASLSADELNLLEDQMVQEELMVRKYKMFAQICTDPQLKQKCEQIAARHQNHYKRMLNQVN